MAESLPALVAAAPTVEVVGRWQRHSPAAYPETALRGRVGYGRWGTRGGFPVLYLGSPTNSVVVEAYRHLVDPVLDNPAILEEIPPRILVTCNIRSVDVLDLRSAGARLQVGLTLDQLRSPTSDRDAYAACQRVAQVAHQLRLHGIVAPAATGLGETLVLFPDLITAAERVERAEPDITWKRLPPDPRLGGTRHLAAVPDLHS